MAENIIKTKRPLGGVEVGTARTEKEALGLAKRYVKPKHRAVVKVGNVYKIYVF